MEILEKIKGVFIPNGKIFYTRFKAASANIQKMSELLIQMCKTTNYELRIQKAMEIEQLENANDEITHIVFTDLHSIFLTPISREDICDLAGKLDDVADFIYACSRSLLPVKMEKTGSDKLLFAQCLGRMCGTLPSLIASFEKKDLSKAQIYIGEIRKMEKEADDLYDYGMRNLYRDETEFKDFIRSREVLMHLEEVSDKCAAVANLIDSICWKQAG